MYAIEIYNDGKYHNIKTGFRLFISKKEIVRFSDELDEDNCSHAIFKVQRLFRGVYCSGPRYYKEIDMFDFEEDQELNPIIYWFVKTLKIYDRDILEKYLSDIGEI